MSDRDPDSVLVAIAQADRGGLGERMGIQWVETTPERVVARMPVEGNTQPFGLLHGGASAVLAEAFNEFELVRMIGQSSAFAHVAADTASAKFSPLTRMALSLLSSTPVAAATAAAVE